MHEILKRFAILDSRIALAGAPLSRRWPVCRELSANSLVTKKERNDERKKRRVGCGAQPSWLWGTRVSRLMVILDPAGKMPVPRCLWPIPRFADSQELGSRPRSRTPSRGWNTPRRGCWPWSSCGCCCCRRSRGSRRSCRRCSCRRWCYSRRRCACWCC
jgi:hypothetical protein